MSDIELYREKEELLGYYNYALFVIGFDEQTVCPKKDKARSLAVQDYFYEKVMEITTSDEYYELLKRLKDSPDTTEIEHLSINKDLERIEKIRKIPFNVLKEGMKITSESSLAWEEARTSKDYSVFEEKLEKLINHEFEVIKYLEGKYKGYDVLLDDMEDDFTMDKYDKLFDLLEEEILPLVKKILALPKKYNTAIIDEKFDIDKQKKLTKIVCDLMGYTNEVGYVGETLHPFTNGINSNDVRTTTKYEESLLFSNLYSVMHEVGHATYELQNNPLFSDTSLMGGASCALHESQSRFYENYLGRSKEFIEFLYPILLSVYPEQISKYTVDDIYYYSNDVSNQFIRTEADELTYPFHIIIRYKIEKMLFNKEIKANEVADKFSELFYNYFGVKPDDKASCAFQDVHWSSGFGYFPTYALGSAISAQFLHTMEKDIDPFKLMKEGNFKPINEWLKDHIHKYGASKKNLEVLKLATGEDFNPKYYIDYLKTKFKKIYNI